MDALAWAAQDGGFLGPLALHTFPATGRGVRATRDLAPGELLLRVPQHRVLTSEGALQALAPLLRAAGGAGAALRALLEEDDCLALAALLLARVGGEARAAWLPYLASLPPPQDVCCVVGAGCWSASELAAAGDAALAQQGLQRAREVAAAHAALAAVASAALLPAGAAEGGSQEAAAAAAAAEAAAAARLQGCLRAALHPSAALWRWCVACVTSRAFISGLGADPLFAGGGLEGMLPLALVPGGDLFNHCSGSEGVAVETEWVQAAAGQGGAYEVRCPPLARFAGGGARLPRAGEEVFISYGDRGARDLCENYGFCPAAPGSNASEGVALALRGALVEGAGGEEPLPLPALLLQRCTASAQARAQLLQCACGLAPEDLELELPLHLGTPPALPTDAARALRILCLGGAEAQLLPEARLVERLERPLSRANETLANALLAALLAEQCLQLQAGAEAVEAEAESEAEAGEREREQGARQWELSAQGAPVLSCGAAQRMWAAFAKALRGQAALDGSSGPAVTAFAAGVRDACSVLVQALQELLVLEERCLASRDAALAAAAAAEGGAAAAPAPAPAAQAQAPESGAPAAPPSPLPWEPSERLQELMLRPCRSGRRAHLAASYRTARARAASARAARAEHAVRGLWRQRGRRGGRARPARPARPAPSPVWAGGAGALGSAAAGGGQARGDAGLPPAAAAAARARAAAGQRAGRPERRAAGAASGRARARSGRSRLLPRQALQQRARVGGGRCAALRASGQRLCLRRGA